MTTSASASFWNAVLRAVVFVCVAVAVVGASLALDGPVARYVASHPFSYSFDLYMMFRLAGYLPLWTIVSIAFALIDSRHGWRAAWSRGGLLFAAVVVSGIAAEVLKVAVRRERPDIDLTGYVFRPWQQDTFSTSVLGWPSSHTAVAFAAAGVLCRVHRRATVIWLLIGVACAFSRLVHNDHFVSDVVGGALIGYGVAMMLHAQAVRRGTSPGVGAVSKTGPSP